MNKYFNFNLPKFNEDYGEDWADFLSIIDNEVDTMINKTVRLRWLADPNFFTHRVAEVLLKLLNIEYIGYATLSLKKFYIRKFVTSFKDKGMKDTYLNVQESIVGVRGEIFFGSTGNMRWDYSRWMLEGTPVATDWTWGVFESTFSVYINVKTVDSDLLDLLVEAYRQPYILPAFYKIYLVDNNFQILRTV